MSVYASQRKETDFMVITAAQQLRITLAKYILHDFGYELYKDLEGGNPSLKYMIDHSRDTVLHEVSQLQLNIIAANSIYITNKLEYQMRRANQDNAIIACYKILGELNFIVDFLNQYHKGGVNTNKYTQVIEDINIEVKRIKGWRKSDNKILKKLEDK